MSDAPDTSPKVKNKRKIIPLLTFEEFSIALASALVQQGKKSGTATRKILKKGYEHSRDPATEDTRVNDIIRMISTCPFIDSLALTLAVDTLKSKRQDDFIPIIFQKLRGNLIRDIGYPIGTERPAISSWITAKISERIRQDEIASKAYTEGKKPKKDPSRHDDWARRMLVCLLGDGRTEEIHSNVLLLLERLYGKSASGERRDFQKQTIDFFAKTGPLKKNALIILAATQPFREGERRMTLRVGELRERIDGYEDRISELKTKVDDLINTVDSLQKMEKQLRERLETRNLELATERDRAHALEVHWRETGRSNLAGFAARTKATLLHEITESILALDGQDPAVSMALDRLRRAKEHLENLENNVEGNR